MKLSKLNNNNRLLVVEKLKSLLNFDYNLVCENNEEDAYFKNEEFIKWLDSNDVEVKALPQSKRGSEGIAYFLDDKVVKISGDKIEASVAEKIKGHYDIAAVIDVLPLKNDKWAILQHFAPSKRGHETIDGLDYIMAFMDNHSKEIILQDIGALITSIISEFPEAEDVDLKGAIILLKKLYDITGFIHDDADPSNVGILNGNVVFTDLGPNRIAT